MYLGRVSLAICLFTRASTLIEIYTNLTVNVQIFYELIEQIEAGRLFRCHVAEASEEHENFSSHCF
jgi:hypothetical protein